MAATLLTNLMNLGSKRPAEPQKRIARSVCLVVTSIGSALPGLQCYHTSVLVNDVEYVFENSGVRMGDGPQSHRRHNRQGRESIIFDFTKELSHCGVVDIDSFETTVCRYFRPGSYDLLRKNCNSFSDCALVFLVGARLDSRYRGAEAFAAVADKYTGLVQGLTSGKYRPNPNADGFDLEDAVRGLAMERSSMRHLAGPGNHVGPVIMPGGPGMMMFAI